MSLLDNLMGAGNNNTLLQLGKQFGLQENQVQSLLGQLAPALSGGFMNHAQTNSGASGNGLSSLLSMFGNQSAPQQMLQQPLQPDSLGNPETRQAGNSILGQIFGSKDVSREVAATAAQKTGIGEHIIKQALPIVALWAASALYKKFNQANSNQNNTAINAHDAGGSQIGSQGGMLSQFLGGDQHHSIAEQVMGLLQNRR